jgi:formylglycine-generating enzyme required for sulfatase activity
VALAERRVKKKPAKVAEPAPTAVPGTIIKDCADCPEMVILPTGIAMGKTEVTQGQWKAVMGSNPSNFSNCGNDCPVESVTWDATQDFIRRLSAKTGKSYRLPNEVEWESACRAGERHEYCGSDNLDAVGWYGALFGNTHAVAGKQANAWGLYDMSGNVREWTQDCWEGNCAQRVRRGGSWGKGASFARVAYRYGGDASERGGDLGFRVARMLDQSPAAKPNPAKSQAATDGQEWAESDNGADINWHEAKQYCASKGSGWRLPTSAELQVSYRSGHSTPCGAATCKVASKARLSSHWFWSNEPSTSSNAEFVLLNSGNRGADRVGESYGRRALCARDR